MKLRTMNNNIVAIDKNSVLVPFFVLFSCILDVPCFCCILFSLFREFSVLPWGCADPFFLTFIFCSARLSRRAWLKRVFNITLLCVTSSFVFPASPIVLKTLFFFQVWKMLASVLHMSNLEFDKVDNEQGEIAAISDREVRYVS